MSTTTAAPTPAPVRFHYAWVIAGVTFLVLLATAGVRSIPPVLMVPLEQEFDWSRATISLAVSINLLLFGLLGPFAASLVLRVGMRRMMVLALSMLTVSVALTTLMREPWQLWLLWGGLVGIGSGAMAGWVSASVATRWFVKRRGIVVGALTAAGATGQLIFLPMLATVVETIGWRAAVGIVAVSIAFVVPIVGLLMRNSPAAHGILPYGATSEVAIPQETPALPGNPFRAAIDTLALSAKDRNFRLLAMSFFICGATTNGLIGTHLIPMSYDRGLAEVTAASLLALIGVFDIIGTMGSGWLSDRFDNRRLLFWYYSLRGLSLLFLPFAFQAGLPGIAIFVVFYGLDWVATVPPTVRLTADLFGVQRVGMVFAWMLASHQLGAAIAAYTAGAIRSSLGDYRVAFLGAGLLGLIAGILVLQVDHSDRADEGPPRRVTPSSAFSRHAWVAWLGGTSAAVSLAILLLTITQPVQVAASAQEFLVWCGIR